MSKRPAAVVPRRRVNPLKELWRNKFLYFLALPAVVYTFIFSYMSLPYMAIAFEKFNYKTGIFSQFVGLKNFEYFFKSSWAWTITFSECANIKALGLTIDTNLNVPNDDGMHFCGCNGVVVSDCRISSGDDCIAISGITNWAKPCENIVIANCVLRSCSKALVMGYIYSHVRNVLIENVIIQESNRGLCFMCDTQGGLVENVRVKNMLIDTRMRAGNWWGNGEAIFFMAMKHDYTIPPEQNPHRETPVNYRSIVLEGITCQSENAIGAVGTQPHAYEEVTLRDITVARKPSANLPLKGNTFDVAPAPDVVEVPENCGVYLKGAPGIRLENVRALPFEGRGQSVIQKP